MLKNCKLFVTFERSLVSCEKFTKNFLEPKFLRKIFCEKISRPCYIGPVLSRGWQGLELGWFWAHTGGSGSVSEAPAMDRLDTRISVHTPLFLPFLERWDSGRKVGVSGCFGVKNFAKNFFDASPCVSERMVKRDIGWGDFSVRN